MVFCNERCVSIEIGTAIQLKLLLYEVANCCILCIGIVAMQILYAKCVQFALFYYFCYNLVYACRCPFLC